jgi:hypothetical protein
MNIYSRTEEAQRAAVIAAAPAGTKVQFVSGKQYTMEELDAMYARADTFGERCEIASRRLDLIKAQFDKTMELAKAAEVPEKARDFYNRFIMPAIYAWIVFSLIVTVYAITH